MFDIDGKFFRGLTKIGDFLILGVIMVLGCIPVVTIGASISAADSVALKLIKDEEEYTIKGYFRAFKSNFKQGLIIELIMGIAMALLVIDLLACRYWMRNGGGTIATLFNYLILGVILVLLADLVYVFFFLARFQNTVINTIKNSLIVCIHHLPQTFIIMIATYGLIYFSTGFLLFFFITVPFILYVDAFIMVRIFRPLEDQARNIALANEHVEEESAAIKSNAEVVDESNEQTENDSDTLKDE